ncbi:DUF3810 family protein [Prolixibacteraceae bacterium]|nr:DUF3810 family protein [Prolixibacteraceae bacterium]
MLSTPEIIKVFYLEYVYRFIGTFMSGVSEIFPFSLWDIFFILLIGYVLVGGVVVLIVKHYRKIFVKGLIFVVLISANWFYISWGYCYGREPMEQTLGIKVEGIQHDDFINAYDKIIADISRMDSTAWENKSDDFLISHYKRGMKQLGVPLLITPQRMKVMTFSRFYIRSGVLGYFGPFFNEVHINGYAYEKDNPFVAFHELTHQQGVGSERDCNFIAFALTYSQENQSLRYSGYLNILPYFIDYFYSFDQEEQKVLFGKLPKFVIQDLRDRSRWYQKQRNALASSVQSKVNDVYLKSNGISEGVMDYGRYFGMVVSWINGHNLY